MADPVPDVSARVNQDIYGKYGDNDRDLYANLGIPNNASDDMIKKAYHKLVRTHHPDKGGNQEVFKMVDLAYKVLSDPEKKGIYDTHRASVRRNPAGAAPGTGRPGTGVPPGTGRPPGAGAPRAARPPAPPPTEYPNPVHVNTGGFGTIYGNYTGNEPDIVTKFFGRAPNPNPGQYYLEEHLNNDRIHRTLNMPAYNYIKNFIGVGRSEHSLRRTVAPFYPDNTHVPANAQSFFYTMVNRVNQYPTIKSRYLGKQYWGDNLRGGLRVLDFPIIIKTLELFTLFNTVLIHRDMKMNNILLNTATLNPAIIDLGLSTRFALDRPAWRGIGGFFFALPPESMFNTLDDFTNLQNKTAYLHYFRNLPAAGIRTLGCCMYWMELANIENMLDNVYNDYFYNGAVRRRITPEMSLRLGLTGDLYGFGITLSHSMRSIEQDRRDRRYIISYDRLTGQPITARYMTIIRSLELLLTHIHPRLRPLAKTASLYLRTLNSNDTNMNTDDRTIIFVNGERYCTTGLFGKQPDINIQKQDAIMAPGIRNCPITDELLDQDMVVFAFLIQKPSDELKAYFTTLNNRNYTKLIYANVLRDAVDHFNTDILRENLTLQSLRIYSNALSRNQANRAAGERATAAAARERRERDMQRRREAEIKANANARIAREQREKARIAREQREKDEQGRREPAPPGQGRRVPGQGKPLGQSVIIVPDDKFGPFNMENILEPVIRFIGKKAIAFAREFNNNKDLRIAITGAALPILTTTIIKDPLDPGFFTSIFQFVKAAALHGGITIGGQIFLNEENRDGRFSALYIGSYLVIFLLTKLFSRGGGHNNRTLKNKLKTKHFSIGQNNRKSPNNSTLKNKLTITRKNNNKNKTRRINLIHNTINAINMNEPYSQLQRDVIHDELITSQPRTVINILYRYYLYKLENRESLFIKLLNIPLDNKDVLINIQKHLDDNRYNELDTYLIEQRDKYKIETFGDVSKDAELLNILGLSILAEYYFTFTDDDERYTYMFDLYDNIPKTEDEAKKFAEKISRAELGTNPFREATIKNVRSVIEDYD
jgi:hypothetical protein